MVLIWGWTVPFTRVWSSSPVNASWLPARWCLVKLCCSWASDSPTPLLLRADVQPQRAGYQHLLGIMWALWASCCCTSYTHLPSRGVSFKLHVAEQFSCTLNRTKGFWKADTGAGESTSACTKEIMQTEQEAEISLCVCLQWGHQPWACVFFKYRPFSLYSRSSSMCTSSVPLQGGAGWPLSFHRLV